MNKDQLQGNWTQLKGKIKEAYGKLSDDDIALYNGKLDQFYGRIQENTGSPKKRLKNALESSNAAVRATRQHNEKRPDNIRAFSFILLARYLTVPTGSVV